MTGIDERIFSEPMQNLMKAYILRHIPNVTYDNLDSFHEHRNEYALLHHKIAQYSANPFTDLSTANIIKTLLDLRPEIEAIGIDPNSLRFETVYALFRKGEFEKIGMNDFQIWHKGKLDLNIAFFPDINEGALFKTLDSIYIAKIGGPSILNLKNISGYYELKAIHEQTTKNDLHKHRIYHSFN